MKKSLLFFIFIGFITGCSRNQLFVNIQSLDVDYLASHHVNTPDYRQKKPFIGHRLIVSWNVSREVFKKDLSLYLTVRFFDNSQKLFKVKIDKIRNSIAFYFPNSEKDQDKKILTYKAKIYTKDMHLVKVWKHQFWTKLIDVDK